MTRLSQSKLVALTQLTHKRVSKSLGGLEYETGPKNSKLYDSQQALPLLYMGVDAQKERARLTHHQANLAELDEHDRRAELVNREEVVQEVSEGNAFATATLLGIPEKVSAQVAPMDDAHEVKSVLESAVHEALSKLYRHYAGMAR